MGGAIDLSNFEKDLYYLYQSQWTEKPMVHILPHWTHPKMKLGTKIPVWVYSNCDEVELFLNNISLGKDKPGRNWDEMQCEWLVPWQPGELKAVAYRNGKVAAEKVIRTADAPSKIALSIDGEPLGQTKKDIVQVRVTTTDTKGEMYPYGENRTFFHVIGPARIKALGNGSPIDVEKHYGVNNRIAFYGLTRAFIESTAQTGDIALVAASILGEKKLITSDKVSIDTQLLALRGKSPQAAIEIFYTVDGTEPTRNSTPYKGAFAVSDGTTVKAIVLLNNESVLTLYEEFGSDKGFVWRTSDQQTTSSEEGGNQAEDAKFEGASVSAKGNDFKGDGFLDFGSRSGYVEWYQENDGAAGAATIKIRYSCKVEGGKGQYMTLVVNGKVMKEKLFFPNTKNWGKSWDTVSVKIPLDRGANTIRLQTLENGGPYIDQMTVE